MKAHNSAVFAAFAFISAAIAIIAHCYRCSLEQPSLSSGQGDVRSAPPPPSSSPSSQGDGGAAALSSNRPAVANALTPPSRQEPAGARGGGPTSSSLILSWVGNDDLDPGMYPTADGLWARTGELWSDESFLSLTEDELHDLLALDDSFGFHGPKRITDILGPLPTKADCEEAVRDPIVEMKLVSVCTDEVYLFALMEEPKQAKDKPVWQRAIEFSRTTLAQNELDLMQTLDERSSFKHWTTLYKAWRRWSQ